MKTIENTVAIVITMILCFGQIVAEEVKQNDVTIEQYFNNLGIEQQKVIAELQKTYRYNLENKNLSSLCKTEEELLMDLRIAAYEQNLLKNNVRVGKEEYADFLKSVGLSENDAELLAQYDKEVTIQGTSFWSKLWFVSVGFAGLCLIINDIKNSRAEKRRQKQKKQQDEAAETEEVVVCALTK